MTKKDYIRAAEIIREARISDKERSDLVRRFAQFFRDDNPRFDFERFEAACDPVNPTIKDRANTKPRPARTGMDS